MWNVQRNARISKPCEGFIRFAAAAAVPRARKGRGPLYRRVRAAIALARLFGPFNCNLFHGKASKSAGSKHTSSREVVLLVQLVPKSQLQGAAANDQTCACSTSVEQSEYCLL